MLIDIDFSIFISTISAEGRISGKIEIGEVPRAGEIISFFFAPNETPLPSAAKFNPMLKVERVIHSANSEIIALQLQDVVLPDQQSVVAVADFLERGFGLFFEPYVR